MNKKNMKSGLMLGVNPNAERQKNDFYAWYVWEKGFNGEPIIRWI